MRFRISGAINKAGWAKGGVENISGLVKIMMEMFNLILWHKVMVLLV